MAVSEGAEQKNILGFLSTKFIFQLIWARNDPKCITNEGVHEGDILQPEFNIQRI